MSITNDLVEQYGNPMLTWGNYPLSAQHNSGGCPGGCQLPKVNDCAQKSQKAHERNMGMEQRGGNNPFDFQDAPLFTQHEVGTGCYNSKCKCDNCHGDCLCDSKGDVLVNNGIGPIMHSNNFEHNDGNQNDALNWLMMIGLAYFIYNLFFKR